MTRALPREGWILAGRTKGEPPLEVDVGGMPHVLRLACDLAAAGVTQVYVVWLGEGALPGLGALPRDPRIVGRAGLVVVAGPPRGGDGDGVIAVRADRVAHRDLPRLAAAAYAGSEARVAIVEGSDAVVVTDRQTARRIAAGEEIAEEAARAAPPYRAFTAVVSDQRSVRRAERMLVGSLRKEADGVAAKAINRRVSLPITRLLCRTAIRPNHVTLIALACALAGGAVIARGGYAAGAIGMLLVELGSIIDGVDGELARLRFQFSRAGQWLDTVVDDVANVAYVAGAAVSLDAAGEAWAIPVAATAIGAFAITQGTQYALIRFVYGSGDLAAIPWAFQSADFLSRHPTGLRARIGATLPKLLKRDFVVTVFFACALAGWLAPIVVGFAAGACSFLVVLIVQLFRNRRAVAAR